ncbi:MAG: hypothetical protein R8N50_02015, partial [Alphaproteobacteria bacterium]|nr:hypothetical protein [Alphaproteobacteria bacterium]
MDFSAGWFFALDSQLRAAGLDSDAQSFDEILENLRARKIYDVDTFASHCVYVILAGGFSQVTAKKIYQKIMESLREFGVDYNRLIELFNNKNKINAICKIWENRAEICNMYYTLKSLDDRLAYLQKLPHIGKITANHLARNLGEDVVKYDIWIQRLGCVFVGKNMCVNNAKLSPEIKSACDNMFAHLVRETGLPRGYIDVVLWKSCQVKLISMDD